MTPAEKPTLVDDDALLTRFRHLMQDVARGHTQRNSFLPWEIEILLDIRQCALRDSYRKQTIERYRKAAERQLRGGASSLLKLSEYLESCREKRAAKDARTETGASK